MTTYFNRRGFSFNEGGRGLNVHLSWNTLDGKHKWFFYVYCAGWRWSIAW